jgi:hypothetical protein
MISRSTDSLALSLSQHDADRAVVERARLAGFSGPTYETLIADLYAYAWPVMLGAIRTGSIVSIKTALPKRTIPVDDRQVLHDSSAEREDLALSSIASAIPRFTESLRAGRWDPAKGRGLRTYFIAACAYAFWHEYDLWSAQRRRQLQAVLRLARDPSADGLRLDRLEDHQEYRQAAELLLSKARRKSPDLEAILQCLLRGMTAAETAYQLGYTERAVEGRMYQFRKTAWGLVRSGQIDPELVPGSRARDTRALPRAHQ